MTNAIINGQKIEISFDYDTDILARVRQIDGRKWNEPSHPGVWTVPATGWHADQVVKLLPEFYIDPAIKFMATGEKVTPKIKLPKELYKFQKEGVKYIASTKGRCIIADDMGLGKSATALTYIRFFSEGRTLIVSPSNVTFKWKEEECARWFPESTVEVIRSSKDAIPDTDIVIMSYGMLEPFFEQLKEIPFENIILDECFPAGTRIAMWDGTTLPIEEIVPGDAVLSVGQDGDVVVALVEETNAQVSSSFVKINGLKMTVNHPVYIEGKGYVKADKVSRGDKVRILREIKDNESIPPKQVLFDDVLSAMESKKLPTSRLQSGKDITEIEGSPCSESGLGERIISSNEEEQSNEKPSHQKESKQYITRHGVEAANTRRQRSGDDSRTGGEGRDGVDIKSNDSKHCEGVEICPPGLTASNTSFGDRGGRVQSQDSEAEGDRQEKGENSSGDGVLYCENSERSSYSREYDLVEVYGIEYEEGNSTVYNFQTTEGNYFAGGMLVHNCHYVKNFKAIRSRMAKALIHGGIPHVLLLSGTPFLNNPGELFSQLHLIDKTSFPNFYSYAIRYCGAFKQDGMWMFPKDVVTNREELEKRLERYMIRRTKQEVELELPELTRSYIPIELNNSGEYKKALAKFKDWKKQAKNFTNALTQLTELRQIIGREKVTSTIELAEEILEAGRKVVIFAHHKEIVALLEKGLKKYGVGIISGDVKAEDRQSYAKKFLLDNPQIRVMLITVAGVEGINLYSAQDIIFCEREWTPAKEEQAEARLHRIGQKSNVCAHYLVVKDTVDEKIDKIVRMKRELIGQVISQDEILEVVLDSM